MYSSSVHTCSRSLSLSVFILFLSVYHQRKLLASIIFQWCWQDDREARTLAAQCWLCLLVNYIIKFAASETWLIDYFHCLWKIYYRVLIKNTCRVSYLKLSLSFARFVARLFRNITRININV